MAESGAESPLDESILKKDLAAEEATAAETVDSDRAKATFAAHKPRANAVFWSKFERPTDPPPARTGVTKNGPALEPVTKVATAVKPAAAGGETLPSIKEFPEEEPAPAASAWLYAPASANPLPDPVSRLMRIGRRRRERLDQGVSREGARPGGERFPPPLSAHAGIAETRESCRRALILIL